MLATSRFILWLPKPARRNAPDPTSSFKWQNVTLRAGLTTMDWGPARLAVAGVSPQKAASPPPTTVVDTFPLRIPHLPPVRGPVDIGWVEEHTQLFNFFEWDGRQVTLRSDAIGLKPAYIAELADGWLLASFITDILVYEPSLARPIDPLAVQSLFIGRAAWDDRTLHQRVKRLASGAVYRWTADAGLAITRERRWQLPPPERDLTFEAFCPLLDAQMNRIMDRTLARLPTSGTPAPLALSLSGGYDSRVLAGLLAERGHRPLAISFGGRHTREMRAATEVARMLGLPQRTYAYGHDLILGQLDRLARLFEGCSDISLGQLSAIQFLGLPPVRLVQGFAGDLAAGALVARFRPGFDDSLDALADAIVEHFEPNAPNLGRLLGLPFDRAAMAQSVRASLGDDSHPLSACRRWGWEVRVRRYVSCILNAPHPWADMLLPYYDADYAHFWSRVPTEGMRSRVWFKQWFVKRFPRLAQVPHPERHDQILAQRQPARALEWTGRQIYKAASAIVTPWRVDQAMRLVGISPDIYDQANLAFKHHDHRIFALLEDYAPALDRQLGLRLGPDFAAALPNRRGLATQPRRLLLSLAAYAHHLERVFAEEGAKAQIRPDPVLSLVPPQAAEALLPETGT